MLEGQRSRRRVRPVAEVTVDALLDETEELTRAWLAELIAARPLERLASLPLSRFAMLAPRVCEGVVRALGSDHELRRLRDEDRTEAPTARVGDLAGAGGAGEVSAVVDALRAVIWKAALDTMVRPDGAEVVELADRLALVMEAVRAAALDGSGDGWHAYDEPRDSHGATFAAEPERPRRSSEPPPSAPRPAGPTRSTHTRAARRPQPPAAAQPRATANAEVQDRARLAAELRSVAPDPGPRGPARSAAAADRAPEARGDAPYARADAPHARAEALWVEALEAEVTHSLRTDRRLALLLVELDDADRLALAGGGPERADARFVEAVRSALRRGDILALEHDARAWIIARDTGRVAARALAMRIAETLHESELWHGAALRASAGIAVLGEDADDAEGLIDVAEEERLRAAAAGLVVLEADRSGSGGLRH